MQSVSFQNGQSVAVTAQPSDSSNPPVTGALLSGSIPTWTVDTASDATLISLTPAADGLSAIVKSVAGNGTVQINVVGMSSNNTNITSSFTAVIGGAQTTPPATQFLFTFGSPF